MKVLLQTNSHTIVYSYLTARALELAPKRVQEVVEKIPKMQWEIITDVSKKAFDLASLKEDALTKNFEDDAQHIALATISQVDILVSWNFKHMVNFFKIKHYNEVNLKHGYAPIDIRSPKEVLIWKK